ncbi:MFS transporter [Actinomadura rupiterrae]|uniref:MFS transporter n=1 Tax=Actinomadura rupiterrae TaxID=559627 RepID=UPI0020A43E13|nr:MFS transporter [Actinomadura rupiterrae]MCP2335034.1 MFS family permease [Actinomadura rupiterrae]
MPERADLPEPALLAEPKSLAETLPALEVVPALEVTPALEVALESVPALEAPPVLEVAPALEVVPAPETVVVPEPAGWKLRFGLLWTGSAASLLGAMSVTTAAPLLAFTLTGSPAFVSWVVAAGTVPGLLLHVPAGMLVDRLDHWRTMLVGQTVRTLMSLAVVLTLAAGVFRPGVLVVAALVSGACTTFYNVAEVTAVPRVVPAARLQTAMAQNEGRANGAMLLGRPLGGVLHAVGTAVPYAADAVFGLASMLAILTLRSAGLRGRCAGQDDAARPHEGWAHVRPLRADGPTVASAPRRKGALTAEMLEGLKWLWRYRFLRTTLIACTATNLLFQMVTLLLVVRARDAGLPLAMVGVLLAAPGLGGSFVSGYVALTRRRRFGRRPLRLVRLCMWAWLGMTVLLAAVPWAGVWMVAWGGVGFVGARLNIALSAYQASRTPPELRGRVAGTNRFVTLGVAPIGTMCGGVAITAVGALAVAWAVPLAIAATGVLLWTARRARVRRLRRRTRRDAAPAPMALV